MMAGGVNDVDGDIVIEQEEREYDEAGNLIQTTSRQRFHDDDPEGTGPLGDVENDPKARVSFQAMWPDAIGRVRVSADYGTNGGVARERPGVAPARSDTGLVSSARRRRDSRLGTTAPSLSVARQSRQASSSMSAEPRFSHR